MILGSRADDIVRKRLEERRTRCPLRHTSTASFCQTTFLADSLNQGAQAAVRCTPTPAAGFHGKFRSQQIWANLRFGPPTYCFCCRSGCGTGCGSPRSRFLLSLRRVPLWSRGLPEPLCVRPAIAAVDVQHGVSSLLWLSGVSTPQPSCSPAQNRVGSLILNSFFRMRSHASRQGFTSLRRSAGNAIFASASRQALRYRSRRESRPPHLADLRQGGRFYWQHVGISPFTVISGRCGPASL